MGNRGALHPLRTRQFFRDRAKVGILTEEGLSPAEIAAELEVSVRTVYRHLEALDKEIQERGYASLERQRARQTQVYEQAAEEAWRNYQESGEVKWFQAYLKANASIDRINGLNTERLEVDTGGAPTGVVIQFFPQEPAPTRVEVLDADCCADVEPTPTP